MENPEDQNCDKSKFEKAKEYLNKFITKIDRAKNKRFSFLLIGRTGVGKSSTVNSLMGKEIAKTNDDEPETMEVTTYESESFGIKFNVIDTPGLCDDLEEEGNDIKYVNKVVDEVKEFDSMWFISGLHETRVSSDEKRAIKIISDAFSKDVWKHAVIIFTFSGFVTPDKFKEKLEKRTLKVREAIAKYAGPEIASNIPSVAIDNLKDTNPDGEEWLGELYTVVFERISGKGALPFFMATEKMIKKEKKKAKKDKSKSKENVDERIQLSDDQKSRISKKIDASIIPGLAATGAAIGSVFGPVGAAAGGVAGATIGTIAWFKS